MPILTLHRRQMFKLSIPYWVFLTPCSSDSGVRASKARSINEHPIGIMQGWNIVYEVVSNGFFALWLARIWFIRDRYFQIIEQK